MIENINSDTYQSTLESNVRIYDFYIFQDPASGDPYKQYFEPKVSKQHHEKKSATCSIDNDSAAQRETENDSLPLTDRNMTKDQSPIKDADSPDYTQ